MGNKHLEVKVFEEGLVDLVVTEKISEKGGFYNDFVFPSLDYIYRVVKLEFLDYKKSVKGFLRKKFENLAEIV